MPNGAVFRTDLRHESLFSPTHNRTPRIILRRPTVYTRRDGRLYDRREIRNRRFRLRQESNYALGDGVHPDAPRCIHTSRACLAARRPVTVSLTKATAAPRNDLALSDFCPLTAAQHSSSLHKIS